MGPAVYAAGIRAPVMVMSGVTFRVIIALKLTGFVGIHQPAVCAAGIRAYVSVHLLCPRSIQLRNPESVVALTTVYPVQIVVYVFCASSGTGSPFCSAPLRTT